MALKLQTAPFQLRNPYRLDRPPFDPTEVWESAIADKEAERLQQQSHQQTQRPLPSNPIVCKQQPEDSRQSLRTGAQAMSSSIKRLKSSLRDVAQSRHAKQQKTPAVELCDHVSLPSDHPTLTQRHQQQPSRTETSAHPQHTEFSMQAPSQALSTSLGIPSIVITHHIESHTELTFERHVEWLTQTALWWDMPVVHLYPAPESCSALEYVETAASRFSSWVNFLKIAPGEASFMKGPPFTAVAKSTSTPARVKGARTMVKKVLAKNDSRKSSEEECGDNSAAQENDSLIEGGMVRVRGHAKQDSDGSVSVASVKSAETNGLEDEPIVGYVFVGSADEQAQYQHVFDVMQGLYPKIEIRYINSFEPQHLQSRQQQELREEPCLHSLSWVHYWSAAKESQVLQSKIVNDVVRVRPMWVNHEYLHRNYEPCLFPIPTDSEPMSTSPAEDMDECPPTFSQSETSLQTSESVYMGYGDSSETGEHASQKEPLRGIPSSVSIVSLLEEDTTITEEPFSKDILKSRNAGGRSQSDKSEEQGYSRSVILSRAQSDLDTHQQLLECNRSSSRRSKRWRYSLGAGNDKKSCDPEYRRSLSTPLLLMTEAKNNGNRSRNNQGDRDECGMTEHGPESDNISPPPPSPTSLISPTSTSSTTSSASTTSITSISSLSLGHRLAGLANRLGFSKLRGSTFMAMDL
ncbi:hypothetical protein KVV02_005813 [Mortierella alpina]|uniref:Uncharacterized protein n=1 Tax=Mortierella alpina TaxID=64518 RepID=A0A9P8A8Q2_MORAP|nr:hypothetical protein KVV02_005813 [Mortierella alpina]